jgi:1-acyl-sn-glycerol-3-phosphate acyltransferase
MKFISKLILCNIFGWKIIGGFPTEVKKYLIIVVPHTSWVDFPIALAVKFITKLEVSYFGKASLFKPPFGWFFRYFGGIPIDRSKNSNMVDAIVAEYNQRDEFIFSLSPEGTRKKVDKWKTGFYHIAKNANVPIVKVALDYKNKEVRIDNPVHLTDNMEKDYEEMHAYFHGVVGRHPELS